MSIDEAIAKYKEITNTDATCPAHCNISCDNCVKESRQLTEWLEELKSYRAHIFSGDMTQVMLKEVYNKAIDDFIHECDRHCGFYNGYNKNLTREDILMIAEQLKAGGENEQRI